MLGSGFESCQEAWIVVEAAEHVFVDLDLEVDADGPVAPDDDVRTDARFGRHVTVRVRHLAVAAVVLHGVTRSLECGFAEGIAMSQAGGVGRSRSRGMETILPNWILSLVRDGPDGHDASIRMHWAQPTASGSARRRGITD